MLPHEEHASSYGSSSVNRARKLVDIAQKARGRTPLKYELTVIPFFCGELPSGLDRLSFVWERGSKVLATEAEAVNPHTRACFWQQHLRQTVTVYQDSGVFVPKEYTLKVQSVRQRGRGNEERKTVGKVKIDLAQFCNAEVEPLPREIFLQLKPVGKLKVSVKAGWLKDAPLDMDSLTEASYFTQQSGDGAEHSTARGVAATGHGGVGDDADEQDLSGFEGAVQGQSRLSSMVAGTLHHGDLIEVPLGPSATSTRATRKQQQQQQQQQGAGANGNKDGSLAAMAAALAAGGEGSPRISAVTATGSPRPRIPGEIPQFSVPMSNEQQRQELEMQKAKVMAAAEQHIQAMRRDLEDAIRAEITTEMKAGRGGCWRALCCCWPRRQATAAGGTTSDHIQMGSEHVPAPEGSTFLPPSSMPDFESRAML